MNERRSSLIAPILIILSLFFLVALTWINARYADQQSGMSAFLSAWAGVRGFMTEGQSPYSEATTAQIQNLAYGRAALPGERSGQFLYPLYSMFIFGPFALVQDFVTARALWMTLLELALLGLLAASISLSRWRPPGWMLALLVFFAFFWYPAIRPLLDGDITILCALFLALALLAVRSHHDALAGFLFALAAIEPRLVLAPLLLTMIWAATHGRWVLFWSPVLNFLLLVGLTSLFMPDWAWQNIQHLVGYLRDVFRPTPGNILAYWLPGVGWQLGWAMIIGMAGIIIWECWSALGKDFRWFTWTFYLTLTASQLVGLDISLNLYVALLPVFVLVLAVWEERWGGLGRILIVASMALLSVGLWAAALNVARLQLLPDRDPLLVFGLPLLLVIGLIWVRWWAIRPPKLYAEILSRHLS